MVAPNNCLECRNKTAFCCRRVRLEPFHLKWYLTWTLPAYAPNLLIKLPIGKGVRAATTPRTKTSRHSNFNFWEESSNDYKTDKFALLLYLPEWHILNLFMKHRDRHLSSSSPSAVSLRDTEFLTCKKTQTVVSLLDFLKILLLRCFVMKKSEYYFYIQSLNPASFYPSINQQEHKIPENIDRTLDNARVELRL